MPKYQLITNFFIFIFFLAFSNSSLHSEEISTTEKKSLTFGLVPVLNTHILMRRFTLLADYLAEQLQVEIHLETAKDFTTFVKRTNNEKRYDIIYTAPHLYYLAETKASYQILARINAPDMVSIIIAHKDSSVKTLEDLRNRTLSTTGLTSLSRIMIRDHLFESGIDPDKDLTLIATPNHNASLTSAIKNIADAASVMKPVFDQSDVKIRNKLRVISLTRKLVPQMAIAVAPWLTKNNREKIQGLLLKLNNSPAEKQMMARLYWPGLRKPTPGEYSTLGWAVKELNFD